MAERIRIERERPVWLRYSVALVASGLAVAVTWLFWPFFSQGPFMMPLLGVLLAGWFGGGGPSLLAALSSGLAIALTAVPPSGSMWIAEPKNPVRLVFFLVIGLVATLVHRSLWSARQRWRQAANDLNESRSRADEVALHLAAIVESSEDAIIGKNLDGVITSWNEGARKLLGYTAEEIIGRPITDLMPPAHKNDMAAILGRIRRGERVEHFETERLKKTGEIVAVSLSVSPIRDSAGKIVGASKIARDVTERKRGEAERERLYREAQEAARVREEFLSIAGHELRTPLTSLQLRLQTVRRRIEAGQSDRALETLQKSMREFERLTRLTEEILDVTRITAGRLTLEVEEMDLGQLLAEIADQHKDAADRAGSDLRVEAPAAIGIWDRLRLMQVATNLLSNALKFGRGKPIDVRVEPDSDWASLVVRDHGIGMSKEDQSRIFERFERAVSQRSYGGMGLGLWITRQIVEAHGGRIEVESEPDEGSTFRVTLPKQRPKGDSP